MKLLLFSFLILFSHASLAGSFQFCLKISNEYKTIDCDVKQVINTRGFFNDSQSVWKCRDLRGVTRSTSFQAASAGIDMVSFNNGPLERVSFATLDASSETSFYKLLSHFFKLSKTEGAVFATLLFRENHINFDTEYLVFETELLAFTAVGYGKCED